MNYQQLHERLDQIEHILHILVGQRTIKDYYSTGELAAILDKAEWTVREWCRLGRINAEKRACGRGNALEWKICHEELERIQNEGLLPVPKY